MVKFLEFSVNIGMFGFKLLGTFEKVLGDASEELGRIGRAVRSDQSLVALLHPTSQTLELNTHHFGPGELLSLGLQIGHAVSGSVFLIQTMGKFMQDKVGSAANVVR